MPTQETDNPQRLIDQFVDHFGPDHKPLACHAALPLILTPELVHYLRNTFLRGQVSWVAEADLLLSDLCEEVGYEQYVMKTAVRSLLIAELRQTFGAERLKQVARLLLLYLRQAERTDPSRGKLDLQAQQWAAFACLDSPRVAREIAESIRVAADHVELARLAKITQELAPAMDAFPELVAYARHLSEFLTGSTVSAEERLSHPPLRREGPAPVLIAGVELPSVLPPPGHPAEALEAARAIGDVGDRSETLAARGFESEYEKLPFPLKNDFLDIVSAIQNGILVPVLGPSVNPAVYVDLAAHLVKLTAGAKLANDPNRKQGQDFVRAYFDDEQMLSVAKTNCRRLSRLYEIRQSTPHLYADIEPCIINASRTANQIHLVLARLLKDWRGLSAAREPDQVKGGEPSSYRPPLPFPLIITSNCDAGLEKEFEKAKIPYDLVWWVAAGRNRGRWMYMPYDPENREERVIIGRLRRAEGKRAASYPIGAPFRNPFRNHYGKEVRIIIIKIFGTINDPSTEVSKRLQVEDDFFLITQDQMELFSSRASDEIDENLLSVILSAKLLFLGFSPNDPDLRAIVNRLYGEERLPLQYWIIHKGEAEEPDQEIWQSRGKVRLLRMESLEQTMIDIERGVRDVSRTV